MSIAQRTLAILFALMGSMLSAPSVHAAVALAIADHSRLCLEVSDDGAGISHDAAIEERVGLGNTRQRLTRLYGDTHSLVLASLADGGARVTVEFPFRTK